MNYLFEKIIKEMCQSIYDKYCRDLIMGISSAEIISRFKFRDLPFESIRFHIAKTPHLSLLNILVRTLAFGNLCGGLPVFYSLLCLGWFIDSSAK